MAQRCSMRISARNSIKGTITSIVKGPVNAEVVVDIGNGVLITSVITAHAVENLNLKEGQEAWAVIKSSEVMIAVD
jgi:molybdopterin-binding protein